MVPLQFKVIGWIRLLDADPLLDATAIRAASSSKCSSTGKRIFSFSSGFLLIYIGMYRDKTNNGEFFCILEAFNVEFKRKNEKNLTCGGMPTVAFH